MTSRRTDILTELRVWFGALAGAIAWACQHVFGYGLTEAGCDPGSRHWDVPIDAWTAVATALAGATAIAGLLASIVVFRANEHHAPPPEGRRYFLGAIGMAINPLFLCIILMSGIGSVVLDNCRQW